MAEVGQPVVLVETMLFGRLLSKNMFFLCPGRQTSLEEAEEALEGRLVEARERRLVSAKIVDLREQERSQDPEEVSVKGTATFSSLEQIHVFQNETLPSWWRSI